MLIISAVVVAVIIIIIVISHYILVNERPIRCERVPQLIISTKEQKKAHTHTHSLLGVFECLDSIHMGIDSQCILIWLLVPLSLSNY